MGIDGISGYKGSYPKLKETNTRTFTANSKNQAISLDKFERGVQKDEIKYERIQARKKKKSEDLNPSPPVQDPASPVVEEPVKTAPSQPVSAEKDLKTYAEKYVALYEKNSGHTLSAEERLAKVSEVTEFYSAPSRTNRLETLVDGLSAAA